MKIFYVYYSLTTVGGADRVITEKANYLAENGHEVAIVTTSQNGREPSFPLSPRVRLINIDIDFDRQYRYNIIMRACIYFVYMRRYKRALTRLLRIEKPDIVMTTLGRDMEFLTSIDDGSVKIGESHVAKEYSRNFHLLEQRGGIYKLVAHHYRRKQEKAVSKLAALVLLTEHDADSWKGITDTYVIPNSLPFYPELSSGCDNKSVLCVGRLNEQKGYEYMVEAWEMVCKRHPDWTVNVYGEGEEECRLREMIARKGLEKSFLIHKPTKNIMEKYLESSIYAMSSRFEGFGMVLIEAMACGVPCVSFDCPYGPADIISDGEDGFLVGYKNSKALADKICFLIENEDTRKQMGRKAKDNIRRYSRERVMKMWTDLFEAELLRAKG